MAAPSSYLLCATPRTGSTLLCSLLTSTGLLGRPESWFREPDEAELAERLGVPTSGGRPVDFTAYVRAVQCAGTSGNGVFAARVMWGSLEHVVAGLGEPADRTARATLERTLGPLRYVHLRRLDVVGQAVSWVRAEQTGHWQQGDVAVAAPRLDLAALHGTLATIEQHERAWRDWFAAAGVRPHEVTYEALTDDPAATVAGIAAHLGVALPDRWRPASPHRRQADATNDAWAAALRADLDGTG